MDNCILLSIRKNWAAAILSGEKRLEIRKCAPSYNPNTEKRAEYPLRVVMYETKAHGGAGAVVGFFDCPGYIGTADPADEVMATLSGLSIEQLEEYRDGGWLYGLKVRNPRRLPEPVPLEALHLDYPPQSWRWLDSINADGLAEIAAAQGGGETLKAPAALPFYLYDFGAIRPDSFLQGDSFKLLEGVQTETVDMVFIDPPYFIKKAEWDTFGNQQEYNDFMARAFWEAERILKPNGTLAFWHNDLQQVARLLCWLENWTQFVFNSWAVWVKPNFRKKLWANPGTGNTLRSWFNITEFCIVLVKGEPGTAWNKSGLALAKLDMNNFGPLREYFRSAQKYTGKTKKQIIDACGQAADHCFRWGSSQWLLPTRETYLDIVAKFELDSWEGYRDFDSLLEEQTRLVKQYDEQIQAADNARFVHNLDANHCNVWLSNEPTGGHSIHPTQKPVDLLERAIRTHTKPGAVVCDFFAGSGSTGVAALKAGRRYILIEQSASYHEKGLAWLEETKSALCT